MAVERMAVEEAGTRVVAGEGATTMAEDAMSTTIEDAMLEGMETTVSTSGIQFTRMLWMTVAGRSETEMKLMTPLMIATGETMTTVRTGIGAENRDHTEEISTTTDGTAIKDIEDVVEDIEAVVGMVVVGFEARLRFSARFLIDDVDRCTYVSL
mmetsp:Transcript_24545/g.41740  ORF Transcript_24545/g.41740 Transcript_24545/m.41740 type:complete len:154 (-) Transcript_24545:65-526(-)